MKKENGRPRMIMLEGPMDIASVFEWFAEESKSIAEQAIEPAQREKFAKLASLWANATTESTSATSLARHDSAESIGAILADSGNHLAGGGLERAP
jgi:hypothetical protein